ncbi:glycerol kinase isoform X2 [Tasmannia lanceolata]|uniref:glycerol kinase isoform X2 n=1 Tax=Tasmannia lanceolata TaxID=3420 RepID=UPI0040646D31
MAISANILSHNKTLIPLDFPFLKFRNPRFFSTSPSPPLNLRIHSEIFVSDSATKLTSNIEFQEKNPDSITKWGDFGRHVSGEWDGFGAEFTREGTPIELPENVVPEAFREWEVKVFDWQTQCPTLAESEEPLLVYKLIKLLPTVGCEADAATRHSIDERNIGGLNNKVSTFAYHPSGSYVAVWPVEDHGAYRLLELEYCLVDPRNQESRVRVIQVVRVEKTTMKLQNIKVFCEQWYGPFRNGEQLGGCAIRDSGFASTDPLKDSDVIGLWNGSNFVANFQSPQMEIGMSYESSIPEGI